MSRTPSAHFVPESLRMRVPYLDPPFSEQYDPHEISIGNGHREIQHLLEIIYDNQSTRISKTKALRLLADCLPGREEEAIQLNGFEVLRPLLLQQPNGILLHSIIALDKMINLAEHATTLTVDIPRIIEIINPTFEVPLRIAAASLLRHIAELVGPIEPFVEGDAPIKIVSATASKLTPKPLLLEMFMLLSKLANNQNVRVPIIESPELLDIIVKSIADDDLRDSALNLAANIAMDSSHRGKLALLNAEILDQIGPLLQSKSVHVRMATVSLISLLAVPKDGKERIAMSRDIAGALQKIAESDADLECRRAAQKCRIFVAELPFGAVIIGQVDDPSTPVPKSSVFEPTEAKDAEDPR